MRAGGVSTPNSQRQLPTAQLPMFLISAARAGAISVPPCDAGSALRKVAAGASAGHPPEVRFSARKPRRGGNRACLQSRVHESLQRFIIGGSRNRRRSAPIERWKVEVGSWSWELGVGSGPTRCDRGAPRGKLRGTEQAERTEQGTSRRRGVTETNPRHGLRVFVPSWRALLRDLRPLVHHCPVYVTVS